MGDELKPCPFCGEKAIRCENFTGLAMFWTQCGSCHACPGGDHATREKADAAWNTRAQSQPTSGDDREEIARIISRIEEEREKAASYPLGDPMCSRHGGIRDGLKEALEIILARQGPGPGEAVAWLIHDPSGAALWSTTVKAAADSMRHGGFKVEPLYAATPTREGTHPQKGGEG